MTASTEQERAECRKVFEFELIDNHQYVPSDFERDGDFYKDDEIQFAWELAWAAWQASRRAQVVLVQQSIEQMAVDRYKVVPSHSSMFYPCAVVAGDGQQQLYIGRAVECQNMARRFIGAFLDGAFVALAAAPQPTEAAQLDDTNVVDIAQVVDFNNAAPVQMPEPVAFALEWTFNGEERGMRLYDDETHCRFDAESDGGVCHPLYTEHQVRQLLAAHGIK